MALNIYIKNNCPYCAQLIIPEGLDVNKINIEEDYSGFKPENLPVMQLNSVNFPGPNVINSILNVIKNAQDGDYKK